MADAALAAHEVLGDEKYLATFHRAQAWFHGENSLKQTLVDVPCGACCDGLQPHGVNRNQGAESTLAYLWTELRSFEVSVRIAGDRKATRSPARSHAHHKWKPSTRTFACYENRNHSSLYTELILSPSGKSHPDGAGLAVSCAYGVQRRRVPSARRDGLACPRRGPPRAFASDRGSQQRWRVELAHRFKA